TDQAAAREYARSHGYGTEGLPEPDGLGRAEALVAFWDLSADDPVKELVEAALGRGLPVRGVPPAGPPPGAGGGAADAGQGGARAGRWRPGDPSSGGTGALTGCKPRAPPLKSPWSPPDARALPLPAASPASPRWGALLPGDAEAP